MTEASKRKAIMDYLDEKVFNPALQYGKQEKNTTIVRGVNLTRARMSRLSSKQMVHYFWSAISGTDKSIRFAEIMKECDIPRFETVFEEFREKFNDDFFRN